MGYRPLYDDTCFFGDDEDAKRAMTLPVEALKVYLETMTAIDLQDYDPDGPCCWLDRVSKRCRWYDFRPRVCREFEIGSEACYRLRRQYRIKGTK
jgi:Fe-S-cluster containining protein